MIILKIIICVLLAVLGIAVAVILLALWLPATAEVSFIDGKLKYRINFSLLKLLDSDGKGFLKRRKRKKNKKSEPEDFSDEDFATDDDEEEYDNIDDTNDIDIDIDIPENDTELTDTEPEATDESDEDNMRSEKIRKIKEKKSGKSERESPEDDGDNEDNEAEDEEDEEDDDEDESESQKTVSDKIESLLNIWDIGGQPLLRAFRGFHIKNVYIDFIVADEDAYKCALNYGRVCNIVYNGLAWFGELFTVSYRTVDVQCGFSLKKSQWDASCKISFRLYNLVIAGSWFLITYIFKIFIPKKFKRKRKK